MRPWIDGAHDFLAYRRRAGWGGWMMLFGRSPRSAEIAFLVFLIRGISHDNDNGPPRGAAVRPWPASAARADQAAWPGGGAMIAGAPSGPPGASVARRGLRGPTLRKSFLRALYGVLKPLNFDLAARGGSRCRA